MKLWIKNILPLHKNILKPIEKIEKGIFGVFDLVLIFGCSGCGFMFKFMGLIFYLGSRFMSLGFGLGYVQPRILDPNKEDIIIYRLCCFPEIKRIRHAYGTVST